MLSALVLAVCGARLQDTSVLDELSHRAFNFFWEQSNSSTGFTKDRAANLTSSDSYTVASIASTGFAMAACALGAKRGWVDSGAALSRVQATLYTVRTRWAQSHGWFYHFVDWRTGSRAWSSEVSSIDTAIFFMGALVAERYFKDSAVTYQLDTMLDSVDWQWMLTNGGAYPTSKTFCMGWTPESGFINARWDTYSELMGLYLLALGRWPDMPTSSWTAWSRPNVFYNGYQCLVGGPLFMHQMSHVFFDFRAKKDSLNYDYFFEGQQDTLANRQYCINNPKHYAEFGPGFWGLSAGDTPDGYMALGAPGNIVDNGTVIPTSAIASVMFTPTESQAAAESFYANHQNAWGRYGFSNGINPTRNWVDGDVIGIDLGMMMLGIADSKDQFAWNLVTPSPIAQTGMARAGFHRVLSTSGPGIKIRP